MCIPHHPQYKKRQLQKAHDRAYCFILIVTCLFHHSLCCAWGFSAHRKIVDAAIHHLPSSLHPFFKAHGQWFHDHINDADRRKHNVIEEGRRHYIDLDLYSHSMDSLQDWFPMAYSEATEKWSEDTLHAHGIGPWYAVKTYHRLIAAFDRQEENAILRHAVDLAHYISDLHVPLHTSANYDGKKTGQAGIHSLWETQLPEMFMDSYNLFPSGPKANWIKQTSDAIWSSVFQSHACLDSVFLIELKIRHAFAGKSIDAYVVRGRTRQLMRSPKFANEYHTALSGQVERRMAAACTLVSSLWFSAWVEAGAPVMAAETPAKGTKWKKILDWLLK